jgi:hypothetical protein
VAGPPSLRLSPPSDGSERLKDERWAHPEILSDKPVSPSGLRVISFRSHHKAGRPPGSNMVVEESANIVVWTPVKTNALPPAGLNMSVLLGTDQQEFFRARLAP